jgi:hypothetical protein
MSLETLKQAACQYLSPLKAIVVEKIFPHPAHDPLDYVLEGQRNAYSPSKMHDMNESPSAVAGVMIFCNSPACVRLSRFRGRLEIDRVDEIKYGKKALSVLCAICKPGVHSVEGLNGGKQLHQSNGNCVK